jgi:VWFA-related protein
MAIAAAAAGVMLGVAVAAQQAAAPAQEEQRPLFRGGARFVRVDVFPTDRNGKPVEGLTAADFELFEDGKRQEIDTFEFVEIVADLEEARVDPDSQRGGDELAQDPRARVFAVVLDTWHVDQIGGAQIRRPLIDMLDRLIGPRDVFGVTTPQLRPSHLVLGRKTVTVADMLERHWTWGSTDSMIARDAFEEYFTNCYYDPRDDPRTGADLPYFDPLLTRELIARARERETIEHLDGLVGRLGAIRDEKKAVVVVTQGWPQFGRDEARASRLYVVKSDGVPQGPVSGGGRILPRNPNAGAPGVPVDIADCNAKAIALLTMDSRLGFKELLRKAQAANVSFYPVDPRGLAVFDTALAKPPPSGHRQPTVIEDFASLRRKRDGLIELAQNTDGIAFIDNNDLSSTLRHFADSLNRYYLLGYYSTNTKFDGGYRRLEVKVRRPDISLKARRGYFAPTQAEIDAMASGRAGAAVPSADAIAVSTALGRLEELRHDRDLFVQAARVPDGVLVSAELGVNARTSRAWADGGEVRITVRGPGGDVVETRPIAPLRSGVAVRVPIADAGDIRVEVRARAKSPGASNAADATVSVAPAGASLIGGVVSYRGLARALQPAADGRYRRTERATLEAPLAGGAVPAGARVLDRLGNPLNVPIAARERADAQGTRWLVGEVTLAPLAEGDYVIELEAMKDEVRERTLFAIRVVR